MRTAACLDLGLSCTSQSVSIVRRASPLWGGGCSHPLVVNKQFLVHSWTHGFTEAGSFLADVPQVSPQRGCGVVMLAGEPLLSQQCVK